MTPSSSPRRLCGVIVVVAAAAAATALFSVLALVRADSLHTVVVECPPLLACKNPNACTPAGECVFRRSECRDACKCQCAHTGRETETSSLDCPPELGCSVKGCTANGTCVLSSWACKEQCTSCSCSLSSRPVSCEKSCDVPGCACAGCTPEGECLFNKPECQDKCRCACSLQKPLICRVSCSNAVGLSCSCIGCAPNGDCIFSDARCKDKCRCGCSLRNPASCSVGCPSVFGCVCIGCTDDGKCLFSDSRCRDACKECTCSP